ncbi:MAG: glycosyltransferase family 4 protein [Oscillospiraceae bacterium]
MRILVVSQYFWPESFRINDICDGLVERGHSVDVLTSLPNIPGGRFFEGYGWFSRGEKTHNGVNITRVGVVQRGDGSAIRLMLNCASFAINSLFHIPKLAKNGYDAVFVFNNSPVSKILPAKVLAKKQKIPNIIYILDIWPESMYFLLSMPQTAEKQTLFRKISFAVSRWFYKSGDTLLVSSVGFEEKLRKMGLSQRIAYFPNYAEKPDESTECALERKTYGLKDEDFVIGFAGNIGKAQGLDILVEAAKRQKNSSVKYLIIGDGAMLDDIKALCKKLSLSDKFVFTGWVDSKMIPALAALCDAMYVSLLDNEVLNLTVPAKLQTYMYAEKPVVACMNGAGAQIVAESCCGVTAAAGDIDGLCSAIEDISGMDKARLELLGKNARAFCEEHYDREKLLDMLEDELKLAVENNKRNKEAKSK